MFKRTKICSGLMLAFGGSIALSVLPALAQQAPAQLERVEVTGSSIKRLASEQSLPVTILKVEDLSRVGVTNAQQALNFVAQNQASVVTSNSVGASNGGQSNADLRGLGISRTLVLVNGKRMVNNPYQSAAVDLNTIPFGAIDRIEVLTDGASAIYGSDAIAGVVNFITRKEYTGFGVSGSGSLPTESGGGESYNAGLTGGIGSLHDQGWNVFAGLSWNQQKALKSTDRPYAASAYQPAVGINKTSGTSFPGNYTQPGLAGTYNPSLPACQLPTSIPSGGICRFDYVPFINIIPEQEQMSLLAKGSIAINKDNTLSLEYIRATNTVASTISPTPITNLTLNSGTPYFPGNGITPANPNGLFNPAASIRVGWRQTDVLGRANEFENTTDRILLNWEGQYKGWDYSATAFQSKADVTNTFTGGYVNRTMIQAGLNGTGGVPFLNPFGPQSPTGAPYLQSTKILGEVQNSEGKLRSFLAQTSGEVYKMPAGSMMLAAGVEFTKDEASYLNNFALIRQAASSGLELTEDSTGSRSDNAFFAELNIPATKELEFNVALRYDKYSDFGSTTNPKVGFRYQPNPTLLIRGSYNTGFRAPTLQDAYAPNSITFTGNPYNDPLLCPNGTVNTAAGGIASRDCGQQFQQQQGGNRALTPETSNAWTIGFAVQPSDSLTFGIDYWNYLVSDSIGPTGEEVIFGNSTQYAAQFVRCGALTAPEQAALVSTCGGGASPNTLAYIKNTQLNLGNYATDGIDIKANWQGAATGAGRFSMDYKGTYIMSYRYQLEKYAAYNDNLGLYFNGNPVAQYRHLLNFGWQYGAWATNLAHRFSSGYTDENTNENGDLRHVASNSIFDLAVTWSGVKGMTLTAGVANLLNTDPPFSNQGGGFQVGYDYRYGNPIGRAFLLRGTYQF